MLSSLLREILSRLVCPRHRCSLQFDKKMTWEGAPCSDGTIRCDQGCAWPVQGGVPRFVEQEDYSSSFALQWKRYRRTQLDSYTGAPYSKQRLEQAIGMPLTSLEDKIVLECGSGAGRFTELLIPNCKALVSIDMSNAVEANLDNCRSLGPYTLLKADINASPLPYHFFDLVLCLGVIQHTPSPEITIASLAKHLKPGGLLVFDHYRKGRHSIALLFSMAYPVRQVLKRLKPEHALRVTTALTAICDPVRRLTSRVPILDKLVARVLPTASYYRRFALLDPRIIREWNELDTFDMLTDWHKHFRSTKEIRRCLERLGMKIVFCGDGGNGVEVRAMLPVSQVDE